MDLKGARDSYGVGCGKQLGKGETEFTKHITFKLGNGRRTQFWHDI